jgi:hypothetical protein
MNLIYKVKPVVLTADSKRTLMPMVTRGTCFSIGTYGQHYAPVGSEFNFIRVFNLEKRRKRVVRSVVKGKKTSTVVRPAHWVAFVYDIPMEIFKSLKLKAVQGNRTFYFAELVRR